MNTKIKAMLISIFILLIIALSVTYTLRFGKPDHQLAGGFYATIKGEITTSEDEIDKENRPDFVKVYHSYHNTNRLANAKEIKIANIEWDKQENKGSYSVTFWLPVEEEVIITSNPEGCFPERVFISKDENLKNKDLKWDTSSCREKKEQFSDSEAAFERARALLDSVKKALSDRSFNNTIIELIETDIQHGWDEVNERSSSPNKNESLFHATYAILYAWRAFYKIELFDLRYCLDEIENELQEHDDECYILPYEGYEGYKSSNSSFITLSNLGRDLHSGSYGVPELEKVKSAVDSTYDHLDHLRGVVDNCQQSSKLISKSLEHQEGYCNRRKITLGIVNFILVIIGLMIGIAMGKFGRRWTE